MYRETVCFVRRCLSTCLNDFYMSEMGSINSNFKLFWCRHDIWLVFLGEEVFLLLTEISLVCVDCFWEILADEG